MKIKHKEIEIPESDPFANCKLAREPYANVLTNIVEMYADGFVLAINNEWGAGKTTFVKMWQQQLKNKGFQTIYFNAWENDFDNNPLVAIMSELQALTDQKTKKVFKSVVEKGAVLVKNIVPTLAKSLMKKYVVDIGDPTLDSIENAAKASTEILEEKIKEYSNKKKTIVEFRSELEKFLKQGKNVKPLIFIVDELDRCRPTYAVEVLEQIKHFFAVSGIVFVLSIDKKHLGSAVKGVYGSEQIDSNEYLRRFIDLEYSIPIPETKSFNEYLFEYYQFNDFFSSEARKRFPEIEDDTRSALNIADVLFTNTKATLRQQERVFALTRLVLCSFRSNQPSYPHLLFILVYLKIMKTDSFQKIENHEFSLQELSDLVYSIMHSEKNLYRDLNYLYIEALLLWFYDNDRDSKGREQLLDKGVSGNFVTPVKSKFEDEASTSLAQYLYNISQYSRFYSKKLSYLISKINLTESVTI
jgi:hypothetical protein